MKKNKSREERQFERELRLAIQMSMDEAANNNQKIKKNKKLKKDLTQKNKDSKKQDNIADKNTDNIPNDGDNGEINEEADIKTTIDEIEKENPKLELSSSDRNYQHPQVYQNNENESNDLSINSIEENNPPIEQDSNQNADLKEPEKITNDKDNTFPIPIVSIPSDKSNDITDKKEALNNHLFVEFQIEAPVPKPNSPKLFINKKGSNPQLPLLANSYSSTTSSSNSEDENIKESNKRKKFSASTNLSFSKDYQSKPLITPTVEQQQRQQQSNEDSYFSHGDDDNFDYNDVEVDEIDDSKNNDADSNEKDNEKNYEFNNNLNSINSQNIHENVNNQIPQSNLSHQPLNGNSSINPNQNLINTRSQINTNTNQSLNNQNYINYIQKRFNTARINDSKLISAFLYLDEYEIKKKEREKSNNRKDQKIELTHNEIPFYSFDFSNGTPTNSFPTDPINPSSKKNMTMGINDDFNINGHDFNDYGLGNALGIQTEMENDFQINVNNNYDKDQNNSSSYSFEIAPYLKGNQQNQQQENEDQITDNNAATPSNDIQSHLSNEENEYELGEDARPAPANNKGRSRYYQQNDEFDSDEDYDSELNENKNDFNNTNNSFFSGSASINKKK